MRARFAFAMIVVIGACAESTVRPEVVLEVDAESSIRTSATHLRVLVYGGDASAQVASELRADFEYPSAQASGARPPLVFPFVLSLSPDDRDASRVYRVVVEARDDAKSVLATTRILGGYREGRVLAAFRDFENACVSILCGDDTTCDDGSCVSARTAPDALAIRCDAGSASYEDRCVDTAACLGSAPCASSATCGEGRHGFLCECPGGFSGDGENYCDPIEATPMCAALVAPTNGSVTPTSGAVSTVATYRCDADYELVGNANLRTRVCQSTLEWSGSEPTCEASGGYPGWPVPETTNHPRTYTYSETSTTVVDSVTGLEWERTMSPSVMSYSAATAHCEALELEGKSDFRLPSRIELLSILDYSGVVPAIDSEAFPATQTSEHTWTRTARLEAPANGRWTVGFGRGDTYGALESAMRFVRCVR